MALDEVGQLASRPVGKSLTDSPTFRLPGSRRDIVVFAAVLIFLIAFAFIDHSLGLRLMGALLPIGIYALLAMGLNIVVGYAGLLDLGYAAFFAIGAYTVGFLTSPASVFVRAGLIPPFFQQFWPALVVAFIVAAIFGVLLGAPTLRLRGDYLAIVTLGFGEIVPNFFLNATQIGRASCRERVYTAGVVGIVK